MVAVALTEKSFENNVDIVSEKNSKPKKSRTTLGTLGYDFKSKP
jgi:hypothetical protein